MPTVTDAVTMRHQVVCYIGSKEKYDLMSVFTENTEHPGATTTAKKYTVNRGMTKNVTGYEWEMPFSADMIKSNVVVADFLEIGKMQKVGADCKRSLCIVDLDEQDSGLGVYKARQMDVVVAIDEFSDNDGEMQVTGTLYAASDPVAGKFTTSTKTFEANA